MINPFGFDDRHQKEYEAVLAFVDGRAGLEVAITEQAQATIALHQAALMPLINELLKMSLMQGYARSDDRVGYAGNIRAREIGETLNQIGGFELMQAVAYMTPFYDRDSLDKTWDGIGTWRA